MYVSSSFTTTWMYYYNIDLQRQICSTTSFETHVYSMRATKRGMQYLEGNTKYFTALTFIHKINWHLPVYLGAAYLGYYAFY